jgi:hypothetical protein
MAKSRTDKYIYIIYYYDMRASNENGTALRSRSFASENFFFPIKLKSLFRTGGQPSLNAEAIELSFEVIHKKNVDTGKRFV